MSGTAVIDTAQREIRTYLEHHAGEAVRPVPLAQKLGMRDIRVVRAALKRLAEGGELVSCVVIKDGAQDHEYRLAAGRRSRHAAQSRVQPELVERAAPARQLGDSIAHDGRSEVRARFHRGEAPADAKGQRSDDRAAGAAHTSAC
jgi:hypothetical protein